MEPDSNLVQSILNLIADNEILSLIILGAFVPAIGTIAAKLLMLPVFKDLVGAACFTAGKSVSLLFTKWLGETGERLEESLEVFLQHVIDKFKEGLDKDDKVDTTKPE